MNVDIFACIDFREFGKIDNFAWIYIRIFDSVASEWDNKSYIHVAHIFAEILKTRTTRKYVQRENFYIHSSSYLANLVEGGEKLSNQFNVLVGDV